MHPVLLSSARSVYVPPSDEGTRASMNMRSSRPGPVMSVCLVILRRCVDKKSWPALTCLFFSCSVSGTCQAPACQSYAFSCRVQHGAAGHFSVGELGEIVADGALLQARTGLNFWCAHRSGSRQYARLDPTPPTAAQALAFCRQAQRIQSSASFLPSPFTFW